MVKAEIDAILAEDFCQELLAPVNKENSGRWAFRDWGSSMLS